jgi:hypothetical protein
VAVIVKADGVANAAVLVNTVGALVLDVIVRADGLINVSKFKNSMSFSIFKLYTLDRLLTSYNLINVVAAALVDSHDNIPL